MMLLPYLVASGELLKKKAQHAARTAPIAAKEQDVTACGDVSPGLMGEFAPGFRTRQQCKTGPYLPKDVPVLDKYLPNPHYA